MKERFIPKFVNGYHVVFDTANYENVEVCYLAKECAQRCVQLNRRLK